MTLTPEHVFLLLFIATFSYIIGRSSGFNECRDTIAEFIQESINVIEEKFKEED